MRGDGVTAERVDCKQVELERLRFLIEAYPGVAFYDLNVRGRVALEREVILRERDNVGIDFVKANAVARLIQLYPELTRYTRGAAEWERRRGKKLALTVRPTRTD